MTELLYLAIDAALAAGAFIHDVYNDSSELTVDTKSDNTPITFADRGAHNLIVEMLQQTQLPILSEEGVIPSYKERKKWQRFWLVDPLDGTKEFINRNGEFTVNIALIENNSPVLGVVYAPETEELYYGIQSEGAWKVSIPPEHKLPSHTLIKERSIALPMTYTREYKVVALSRSHMTPETEAWVDAYCEEHDEVVIESAGSSLKYCKVAEGVADIHPRLGTINEWDSAAGDAVVRAAGKEMVTVDGETPLTYNKEDLKNPWFLVR